MDLIITLKMTDEECCVLCDALESAAEKYSGASRCYKMLGKKSMADEFNRYREIADKLLCICEDALPSEIVKGNDDGSDTDTE